MEGIRQNSIKVFSRYLKKDNNVTILEDCIYKYCLKKYNKNIEKHYRNIIFQVTNDLHQKIELTDIISSIKKDKIGWNHSVFKDIQNKLDEQDNFIENPFEVEEGVQQCKAYNKKTGKVCNSKRVIYYQRQERGADEPMTTYNTCYSCGTSWKYSG